MPCWGVLLGGLLVVERERAVRARQLLDCGQRQECVVHSVPCGDVQRGQRVDCVERVLGMPCGGVLSCGLQLVQRERAVWCRQLLDRGQWHKRILQCVPRRSILPCWLRKQQREWGVRCGQLLRDGQRRECCVHGVPSGGVLLGWLLFVERERVVQCGQLLDCGQRHQRILLCVCGGNIQRDERVHVGERMPVVSCGRVLLGWMRFFRWERFVQCGQLLDFRQWNQLVVCCLPRRQVLS